MRRIFFEQLLELFGALAAWVQAGEEVEVRLEGLAIVFGRLLPSTRVARLDDVEPLTSG